MDKFIDLSLVPNDVLVSLGENKENGIYEDRGFSICVVNNKILSLHYEGYDIDDIKRNMLNIHKLDFRISSWKYPYYVMMYLYEKKNFDDLELLVAIINDYDLCKLTQRQEIGLLDFILKRIPKSEIIPAAMQNMSTIKVFLNNGWELEDHILIQYYDKLSIYRRSLMYFLSVRSVTDVKILKRFIQLAVDNNDLEMIRLLVRL